MILQHRFLSVVSHLFCMQYDETVPEDPALFLQFTGNWLLRTYE